MQLRYRLWSTPSLKLWQQLALRIKILLPLIVLMICLLAGSILAFPLCPAGFNLPVL